MIIYCTSKDKSSFKKWLEELATFKKWKNEKKHQCSEAVNNLVIVNNFQVTEIWKIKYQNQIQAYGLFFSIPYFWS